MYGSDFMNDVRRLKILVADDTDTDRLILESIVRKEGHHVVSACNGLEAIQVYSVEKPDIVLLDALMPELDGFGAARKIKELAGDELVPIIFLTSLSDTESLVQCLDAGGDDFLSKPYNRIILQAKIKSFNRMREMHSTMLTQRNQIVQYNNRLLQEQTVAKHVFDNVAHSGCLNASNVRYFLSSLAVFNGDVLVAAMRPNGSMMVLLGDFTGHGLPAAIGAMPLASTFYGMVSKGFSMTDILREINGKLKNILPVGIFCCATMMDINFRKKRLKIWNGGLPDCFVYHHQEGNINQPICRSVCYPIAPLKIIVNILNYRRRTGFLSGRMEFMRRAMQMVICLVKSA
jgi:DNA-binding response OmpR family regulator